MRDSNRIRLFQNSKVFVASIGTQWIPVVGTVASGAATEVGGVVGIRVPRYSTPGALWCRHSQPSTRNLARQLHDAIRRADARVFSNSATGLAGRPRRVACAAAAPRQAVKASQQGGGEITSSPLTSRCRARKNQEPRLLHLLIHRQGLASRAGACYTKQVAPAPDSVGTWPSLAFLSGCPAAACVAAL